MMIKFLRDSLRLYPKDLSRYRTAYAGVAVLGLWCMTYFLVWTPTFAALLDLETYEQGRHTMRICAYLWGTTASMGIVLAGAILSDLLVVRLQTARQFTIGQLFTWRIMPLVFSAALNILFIATVYLSIHYRQAKSIVDSIVVPLANITVVAPVLPMAWCILRGLAFSSVIPGKRGYIAVLVSMVIIVPASGCAWTIYCSIIYACMGTLP